MTRLDVVVHRLLAASIGAAPLPSQLTQRNVQDICSMINRRHRMADIAGFCLSRSSFPISPMLTLVPFCRNGLDSLAYPRLLQGEVLSRGGASIGCQVQWYFGARSKVCPNLIPLVPI